MPVDYSDATIVDAFEGALRKLVIDRTHPEALVVAKHIITFAKTGVRDPTRLRDLAVAAIRVERRRSIAHDAGASEGAGIGPTLTTAAGELPQD